MAFKFNLQRVLAYREQLEEEAKSHLGKIEGELRKAERKLLDLEGQFNDACQKCAGKLMQSGERWLHDQFVKGLAGDVKNAHMQKTMLVQLAEEARQMLAARSADRKMLERLKERQKKIYNKNEQKQEQNFNDEISTIRYKASAFQNN